MLPLDTLKLDRTMVDGIAADPRDLAVLRGIIAMARALELTVVVEGVETAAQRDLIAARRVRYLSGVPGRPRRWRRREFAALIA